MALRTTPALPIGPRWVARKVRMAREAKKLDDATIKAAKPADKPFRLADGDGLSLLVTPDGGKFWRYRYRRPDSGSNNEMSLGCYPELSQREHAQQRARPAARPRRLHWCA
jgi:hypothetical protein